MVISSRAIDACKTRTRQGSSQKGEEEAGFGLAASERAGEIGTDFAVNIILLIGRIVKPFPLPFLGISSFLRDSARRVRQNLATP